MADLVILDVEGAVRLYLRSEDVCAGRVYFGYPTETQTGAFVTLSRVGGGPIPGQEAPIDEARISCACWSATKKGASDAAAAVANAFHNLNNLELPGGVFAYGAAVQTVLWAPDPAAGSASSRYVVDALVTVRGSTV